MEDFNSEHYRDLIKSDRDPLLDDDFTDYIDLSQNKLPNADELAETIKSGREIMAHQADEAKKVTSAISELFTSLNQQYGFDIHWNADSFSDNLRYIMLSSDQKAMELYISEGYSKVRLLLYQQFLSAITTLAAKVLDPSFLLSSSLTFEDQMNTIEKLFGFLEKMNSIYSEIHIDNVGEKLSFIKEHSEEVTEDLNLTSKDVREYLDKFRQAVVNGLKQDDTV